MLELVPVLSEQTSLTDSTDSLPITELAVAVESYKQVSVAKKQSVAMIPLTLVKTIMTL